MENGYTLRLSVEDGIPCPPYSSWYHYYYAVNGRDDPLLLRLLFIKVSDNVVGHSPLIGRYLQDEATRFGLIDQGKEEPIQLYRVIRNQYAIILCKDAETAERLLWLNGVTVQDGITVWLKRHIDYHGGPAKYQHVSELTQALAANPKNALALQSMTDHQTSAADMNTKPYGIDQLNNVKNDKY